MNVDRYLARIRYYGTREPSLEALESLIQAQLTNVAFENFDIHLGVPLRLDIASLYRKIVLRGRGGFCYELNLLFAELLRELGYDVELLSARVFRHDSMGPEFDHMALRVQIDGGTPYLVDVGFGNNSTLPLELKAGVARHQRRNDYRLLPSEDGLRFESEEHDGYIRGYRLSLEPRQVNEFGPMLRYHQTSARSWFTQARICVLVTEDGRRSLVEGTLRDDDGPARQVSDAGETLNILRDRFGVDLPRMPSNMGKRRRMKLNAAAIRWQTRAELVRQRLSRLVG